MGGHEGVGHIVKLGPGADTAGVKIGDRVGVKWVSSTCGNCGSSLVSSDRFFMFCSILLTFVEPCQAGSDGLCFNQEISGYFTPGTFQQYVLSPAHYVSPIPDRLDSAEAAPMLCAGTTIHAALKRSNARPGQWIVIAGAGGGLGHLGVQLASRGMGLRVIGVDHPSKADIVLSSGAEHFVDITQFSKNDQGAAISSHIISLAGGLGAHAVIVCTGSDQAYANALRFLRFNGTLVCVGIPEHGTQSIESASPGTIIGKQYNITGSAVGNRQDALEVLDFAARGIIKARVRIESMDSLATVFQEMKEGKLQGRVVLDLQ